MGQGAAGGGTTFNGLDAADLTDNDNITVSGSGLSDSYGALTSEGFTISPVGSDNETGNGISAVNGGYVFINSANNDQTSVDFTISGLGSATTADLFFYTTDNNEAGMNENAGTVSLSSGTQVTYTDDVGEFDSTNTIEFEDVTVTDGAISGTYNIQGADTDPAVLSGLSIDTVASTVVPEPSTWALMVLGAGVLVWRLRRRSSSL